MIAVADGIPCPPQHHTARARTKDRALRPVVEGVAMAVGRQDLTFLMQIAARVGQFDGHPARQRHVAFAAQKRLRRIMHRDKAGGTGGLHVHRRPLQVEDVADAGGQEILVVAGMAQKEHAGLINQIAVRAEVEVEIAAHAAAGINPDCTAEILGRVARVLKRFPCHLKELAVLGIKDRGVLLREAEEFRVKPLEPVQNGGGGNIIRPRHPGRAFACGQQVFARQHADRFHAGGKVLPIGRDVGRAGQMRRHADHRDIGFGNAVELGTVSHPPTPFAPACQPAANLRQTNAFPPPNLPAAAQRRQ